MSNTHHHRGQKHRWVGWDFWSKRGYAAIRTTISRRILNRKERRRLQREAAEEARREA